MNAPRQGQPPTVALGTTPQMQSHLAELVATGIKRATTSVLADYEAEGEPLPEPGELATVVDGSGQAVCTIRTTHVEIRRYADIDVDHAYAEGEDDRTLQAWHAAHEPFLADACASLDIAFDDDLELVLAWPPGSAGFAVLERACPIHVSPFYRRSTIDPDSGDAMRRSSPSGPSAFGFHDCCFVGREDALACRWPGLGRGGILARRDAYGAGRCWTYRAECSVDRTERLDAADLPPAGHARKRDARGL